MIHEIKKIKMRGRNSLTAKTPAMQKTLILRKWKKDKTQTGRKCF